MFLSARAHVFVCVCGWVGGWVRVFVCAFVFVGVSVCMCRCAFVVCACAFEHDVPDDKTLLIFCHVCSCCCALWCGSSLQTL